MNTLGNNFGYSIGQEPPGLDKNGGFDHPAVKGARLHSYVARNGDILVVDKETRCLIKEEPDKGSPPVPLDSDDVTHIERIETNLGKSADSYFRHSGGKVTLSQARVAWKTAKELIELIKQKNPNQFPKS